MKSFLSTPPLTSVNQLFHGEQILKSIIANTQDAIIAKDVTGKIISWNPAAEKIFGYSQNEAIGENIRIIVPEEYQREEEEILRQICSGNTIETFSTRRVHKDGHLVDIEVTISPILDINGTVIGASKIARDISESIRNRTSIQHLLLEVNHRVKNQYAVILAIINETAKTSLSVEKYRNAVHSRIHALSRSQDMLTAADWQPVSLHSIISAQLSIFGAEDLVQYTGGDLKVNSKAALYIGMAIHELTLNSKAYGAISNVGLISISLNQDIMDGTPVVKLTWEERLKSSAAAHKRSGFGTTILHRVTPNALLGRSSFELRDNIIRWTLLADRSGLQS